MDSKINLGKKTPIALVPPAAIILEAEAMLDGARKYGPFNWRTGPRVSAMERMSAAMRHILSWMDGEEAAEDSLVSHLAHARADLGIVLDAQLCGVLDDDRPEAGQAAIVLGECTREA